MAQSSESESEIYLEDAEYDFDNLDVTIAVTEAEGEDIEEEFNDALSEIHGEKSFPCAKCEKVCKARVIRAIFFSRRQRNGSNFIALPARVKW